VVLNCKDPDALVEFWTTALGYRLNEKMDEYRVLVPAEQHDPSPAHKHGPVVVLAKADSVTRGANRMHLDLHPDDAMAHITRMQRLGATVVDEPVERFGIWWQVMADPEGNEFCIVSGADGPDVGDASSG